MYIPNETVHSIQTAWCHRRQHIQQGPWFETFYEYFPAWAAECIIASWARDFVIRKWRKSRVAKTLRNCSICSFRCRVAVTNCGPSAHFILYCWRKRSCMACTIPIPDLQNAQKTNRTLQFTNLCNLQPMQKDIKKHLDRVTFAEKRSFRGTKYRPNPDYSPSCPMRCGQISFGQSMPPSSKKWSTPEVGASWKLTFHSFDFFHLSYSPLLLQPLHSLQDTLSIRQMWKRNQIRCSFPPERTLNKKGAFNPRAIVKKLCNLSGICWISRSADSQCNPAHIGTGWVPRSSLN